MSVTPFQKAYSSLNENQKLAVDTLEGPVMVMAGPGTGKTQVLTLRIAKILEKTDTDPSSILALTFTENAAKEMRSRLINLIGKDAYYVRITTFHSFCNDIIAENPERFSRPAGMSPATDLERIEIITELLDELDLLFLKPLNNPTLYLHDIISTISDLKREGISEKKYASLVRSLTEEFEAEKDSLKKTAFAEKEKLVGKNLDLLALYKRYNEELSSLGRFDYEDMINWVVVAFESDDEFLLSYQEKFQYLLVDEYQDTNSAQNRLIFALAKYWGQAANLFVVGDVFQSIFRFQGASEENVHQFEKLFPKATMITLADNYRSTPTILATAARLIGSPPLNENAAHTPEKIKVLKFSASLFEDDFLMKSIAEKIASGVNPSDIAVIVKENKEVDHLANLMKQKGMPYRLEGGVNILTTPLINQFLTLANLVVSLASSPDDLDLFIVLNYPYFHLDPLAILKLARQATKEKTSLVDLLTSAKDIDSDIISVFSRFVSWSHLATHKTLPEMFQKIFQESGLMNHVLGLPQPLVELNRFTTLYQEAKKQLAGNPRLDLVGFVKNLKTMEEHGLKLPETMLASTLDAVTLTTAHKAKGLEWLTVYIYRFADTHWGNKRLRQMIKLPDAILDTRSSSSDKEADERRLFYVAITRAKKDLILTGATSYQSSRMTYPSLFLSDLPEEHLMRTENTPSEKASAVILHELLSPPAPTIVAGEEEYLKSLIADFKLSPTALNNYLECRYKFKLDNLYRIPKAKSPSLAFGTAVHSALESLYRKLHTTGKLESKDDFLFDFESALKHEVLSKQELKSRLAHGKKILSAYYDHYQNEFSPALFTEKNFGRSTPVLLDDIPLSGKSDRIDPLDPKKKMVRFVDYKTGKPKTRGVLEKEAEGSDGNYKRQLVFYQLLSQLDKTFGHKIGQTILDFIEPEKDGSFRREKFIITPDEVEKLKATIRAAAKSIRALDFARTTDASICSRCDFRKHCWPSGHRGNNYL
jgi:DNA helicase-2/ATP-dependent DNA helicase PcrA